MILALTIIRESASFFFLASKILNFYKREDLILITLLCWGVSSVSGVLSRYLVWSLAQSRCSSNISLMNECAVNKMAKAEVVLISAKATLKQ